jgi:hypothetical protein
MGIGDGLIEDPASPGDPYIFEFTIAIDLNEMVYAQSADILFIAQPDQMTIEFIRSSSTSWAANTLAITSMPTDWNATDGYPQFVDFYEQRMCLSATVARPQTLWFSKAGDYYDHGVSSPIEAADAAVFTLDSGRQGPIQWTAASSKLMVGTLGDEWTVSGSGYEPLSFASIRALKQTNDGSKKLRPMMIGPVTIFLQKHGRTVYQYVYDFNRDSYMTVDLSVLATHLTDEYSIIDWTYQQVPFGIIWGVREDGELLGLTFKREHNVTGWHVHDTDGKFLSCTSVPGNREDDLWLVVEREIDGVTKWYIERKASEYLGDDHTKFRYLDCYRTYTSVSTVTGLDFLEGKEVHILADGAIHPPRTVVSGGITLQKTYGTVTLGLPYTSEVRPLPVHMDLDSGTSEGRTQIAKFIQLGLYKSLGFSFGRTTARGEKMEEAFFRTSSNSTGAPVPLFTGFKKVTFPEGWNDDGDLIIRQTWPYPLTVRSIIAHIHINPV